MKLKNIHPGEMLKKQFLEPMEVTQYHLGKSTGIPHSRITDLIKGRRGISPRTAIAFSKFFGNSAEFWMNLQSHYDLNKERQKNGTKI